MLNVIDNLAFVCCLERGKLEDQTVLLCRSIREFGGAYREAPIYAFQPRRGHEAGDRTVDVLCDLGVVAIRADLNRDFAEHGTLNKVFTCAHAERIFREPTLVFLDSDTVVIAEPTDLDLPPEIDLALRPADSTRLNSRGPDDPMDAFWGRVFDGPGLDDVPYVSTELGRRVRAYFSAGLVAVRREAGVFREWEDDLRRLVRRGSVPEGQCQRMDEVALAATVVRRFPRTRLLDMRYNYLIYRRSGMVPVLRSLPLDQIVHIHYRFAFYKRGFLRTVRPPLEPDSPVFRWLDHRLPLEPIIEDADDVTEVPS